MRYLRSVFVVFRSLPVLVDFLTSKEIGDSYGVGFRKKFILLFRFYRNIRRVETLSDLREHMELAAAVLRVPKATAGSVVEAGCYVGGSTVNLSLVCAMTGRKLIVFDSFQGLPEPEHYDRWHRGVHTGSTDVYFKGRFAAAQETVERNVSKFGNIDFCEFRAGYFDETMPKISEPVVMAFLDVDLIDSLKPCLIGLWPNLPVDCRLYTHEARNLALISLYFDKPWWRETFDEDPPGFVGSGVGLPLGVNSRWGSELGYAQKPGEPPKIAPDWDPEVLRYALLDCEKAFFRDLLGD